MMEVPMREIVWAAEGQRPEIVFPLKVEAIHVAGSGRAFVHILDAENKLVLRVMSMAVGDFDDRVTRANRLVTILNAAGSL